MNDLKTKNSTKSDHNTIKLATLCGYVKPAPIYSISNVIQIRFQTDSDGEYKGFIGVYKSIECNRLNNNLLQER